MEPFYDDAVFGRWVRRRRRALDLTQKELARRVGCSVVMIRKLEREERRPSKGMAEALAGALGVPSDEHAAFVRFARSGWADDPPSGSRLPPELPWQPDAGAGSVARSPERALLRPPGAGAASGRQRPEAAPAAPRIVARTAELERLEGELEHALAGGGRSALIAGEAGQGKTALMSAFAARAQSTHPDLLVAVGTCNAYTGRGDPFLPFRQILAQLTGEVPAGAQLDAFERERAARLAREAPRAAEIVLRHGVHLLDALLPAEPFRERLRPLGVSVPPLPPATPTAPARRGLQGASLHDQQALRAEAAAVLTALAERAPLLLLLDDLHWLDDSSAELLLHLARVARGSRLMLVGAYRPADLVTAHSVPHPLHELTRSNAASLDLDRADGRAFVDAWLDREANALGEDFRASLWRQTAGHPLLTIELLRAMQERGDLVQDGGGVWSAAPGLRWDRLPARIAETFAARMERLDADAMDVLRVASVEGEMFTAEVVARVLNRDPRDVVRLLGNELDRRRHLVAAIEVRRGRAGLVTRYRFRHNLIQRYVYDAIDTGERAYLHDSVAVALEALLGDDADAVALALHYTLAQAPGRAARHHRRAGDRARQTYATDRAIEHYRAALEHWPDPDPLARAQLQFDLGECEFLLLQREEARRDLTAACSAFEAAGDVRSAAASLCTLALIYSLSDDYGRAFESCRRAVSMLEPLGESTDLAAAINTLSRLHMLVSEFQEALRWGERALAIAERRGAVDVLLKARIRLGSALTQVDPPRHDEGVRLLETAMRTAEEQGSAYDACHAAYNLADALNGRGHYDRARARYLGCLEYARGHQIANFEYYALCGLWRHLWAHGDWSEAFAWLPSVRRGLEGTGIADFPASRLAFDLALCELDVGRAAQARSILARHEAALSRLARPGERLPNVGVHLRVAAALGDMEAADDAAAVIADAVDPAPPIEYDVIAPVLEALRHLTGRPAANADRTEDRVAACLNALERLERHYGSPEARAALQEGRALKAAADGSAQEAAHLFAEAADHWHTGTFQLLEARTRAAASHALRAAGLEPDAASQQARARSLLASLTEQIPEAAFRDSFARLARSMVQSGRVS